MYSHLCGSPDQARASDHEQIGLRLKHKNIVGLEETHLAIIELQRNDYDDAEKCCEVTNVQEKTG